MRKIKKSQQRKYSEIGNEQAPRNLNERRSWASINRVDYMKGKSEYKAPKTIFGKGLYRE
jgi:hypothetical protein